MYSYSFYISVQVLEWVNSGRPLALEFPVTADGQCDAVAAWFKLYLGDYHSFTLLQVRQILGKLNFVMFYC
jgi:hypothetical protein